MKPKIKPTPEKEIKKLQDAQKKLTEMFCQCDCGNQTFYIHNTNWIADQTALDFYCAACLKKQ